ncbi:MAG: FecR domain-containing protein [Bacteroidota bacterium]
MENKRFWMLMTQYLSGEATVEEIEELNEKIESNKSYGQYFERATKTWNSKTSGEFNADEISSAKQKFLRKLALADREPDSFQGKNKLNRWLKIAASIAVIALISIVGIKYLPQSEEELQIVKAEAGSRQEFILPDGTHVWLNSSSTLSYNKKTYNKTQRKVELSGEAFFEVQRNEMKSFIVSSGDIRTVVLGTSFNVKSYPNDLLNSVSVEEGKVVVFTSQNESNKILLQKDDEVIYDSKLDTFSKRENIDTKQRHAWREGKIVFDNIPLNEALKVLARKFNVTFEIKNKKSENCLIKGDFQSESLQTIMNMLSATIGFEHQYHQDLILIKGESGCEKFKGNK